MSVDPPNGVDGHARAVDVRRRLEDSNFYHITLQLGAVKDRLVAEHVQIVDSLRADIQRLETELRNRISPDESGIGLKMPPSKDLWSVPDDCHQARTLAFSDVCGSLQRAKSDGALQKSVDENEQHLNGPVFLEERLSCALRPSETSIALVAEVEAAPKLSRRAEINHALEFTINSHSSAESPVPTRQAYSTSFWLLALDSVMSMVILLNTITIGVSMDIQWDGWPLVDAVFALLFSFEVLAKICLLGARKYACGAEKWWHIFEITLVAFALAEVILAQISDTDSKTSLLRVARLVRITKIIRVCRLQMFADLTMMINGAVGGVTTLLWSVLLICLPLYMVALILRETVGNLESNGVDCFSTLSESFFTIFRCIVAGDCSQQDGRPIFVLISKEHGWFYGFLYLSTVVFMTFGLFNVIVAIYVENTVAAAKHNDLQKKQQRLMDKRVFLEKTQELLELIWQKHKRHAGLDESEEMSQEIEHVEVDQSLFSDLLEESKFQEILSDLDIAEEEQVDLFDTLDVDGGGTLDVGELIVGISKLRGDPRRADIVSVSLVLRSMQENVATFMDSTTKTLRSQNDALALLTDAIAAK
eukprot:TRINITY_DN56461_c0_g1_i1.p1 TRINITY_DN56461_c0_g1~~TRINITY_DN56461_c0_g1_i1.p1  ORF type:complete len:590 (-),score=91.27 TRINITY_DN56461_c0_g1_i1:56-1825(-)